MGRGGRLGSGLSKKRKVRSKDKGSDDSDEDYTLGEDEESEEYCSSLAGDESEEGVGEFEEEEEKVRKVVASKGRKSSFGRKKTGVTKPQGRKRISYKEEDVEDFDEEDCNDDDDDDDDDEEFNPDDEDEFQVTKKNKKIDRNALREVGLKEEDDEDYDEEDYNDDEEFNPEDELKVTKRNKKIDRTVLREVSLKEEDDEDYDEEDYNDDEEFNPEDELKVTKRNKKIDRTALREKGLKEEDDEDCDDEDYNGDEEFNPEDELNVTKRNKKIDRTTSREKGLKEEDDEDQDEEDYNGDEEFNPDEIDGVDDEEELEVTMKNKKMVRTKKRRKGLKEEDDEDYDEEDPDDDEEFNPAEIDVLDDEDELEVTMRNKKKGMTASWGKGMNEEDDGDCDEEDYNDDEEFNPDEIDSVDDEDELELTKNNRKIGKTTSREKGIIKGWKRKRKRNSKIVKKPTRKKPRKNHGWGRKSASDDIAGEFTDKRSVLKDRTEKTSGRRRKMMAHSDSDFVSSESSDFEYTVSEEEREQVREASKLCSSLTTSLRNSSLSKKTIEEEEEEVLCQQRKRSGRKGKEKVQDLKIVVGKQVCGICLSEEGKKSVRGTLSCCSHYFCFACIMEWSKVESRCPLCKQRFTTISKPTRSNAGFDLRTAVIQVPERDQVYQPSEEELRGYLDPYESVICTECQQGGDDALMLLCDLCDSPAHTYCIGLGHEVPEGNWYCEGCRPTALGSSTPQALNSTPDSRTSIFSIGSLSPAENLGGGLDLNVAYVPDTPLTQGSESLSSPRSSIRDNQAGSPVSRAGAFTVSQRRRIHHQINHLLNNRMSILGARANGISATNSGTNSFGYQIGPGREFAYQPTVSLERATPCHTSFEGSFQDNPTYLLQNRDLLRGQVTHGPTSTSTNTSMNGIFRGENTGINSRSVYELHPCSSRSSFVPDNSTSPYMNREVSHSLVEKEQVQSMVRSCLKSLSRDTELGSNAFKDIARRSTHTILAACGLEHRESEVHAVQPPPLCNHVEQTAMGQTSMMKGHCSTCFDLFVNNIVQEIMNTRVHPWFRGLGF